MNKKYLLYGLFVIIVLCLTYLFTKNTATTNIEDSHVNLSGLTPEEAEIAISDFASDYIRTKVGSEYFESNYEMRETFNNFDGNENNGPYGVMFNYKPATKVAGRPVVIYLSIMNGKLSKADGVFNCVSKPQHCEFAIDRNEAIKIIEDKGFWEPPDAKEVTLTAQLNPFDTWVWSAHSGGKPGCSMRQSIFVRVSDGKVAQTEAEFCVEAPGFYNE